MYQLVLFRRADTYAILEDVRQKLEAARSFGSDASLPVSKGTLDTVYAVVDGAYAFFGLIVGIFALLYVLTGLRIALYRWPGVRISRLPWAIASFALLPFFWIAGILFPSAARARVAKAARTATEAMAPRG